MVNRCEKLETLEMIKEEKKVGSDLVGSSKNHKIVLILNLDISRFDIWSLIQRHGYPIRRGAMAQLQPN